ncbi:MAG TPA: hypothetical protein VGZ47_13640, partial [Gemmataceae bacterium]|nr:hypothetical protein [Gemmataceae bacterium]
MFASLRACAGSALLLVPVALFAAEPPKLPVAKLQVFPAKIELTGPRDQQRIGVLAEFANGAQGDCSHNAHFSSGNASIATVDEHGLVIPVSDGTTTIAVEAGGKSASISVAVKQAKAEVITSYVREVLPVLTKAGCNQGACHGSQHGRGGFKLSLFGFDPQFDHSQIVQSAKGRRVVVSDP